MLERSAVPGDNSAVGQHARLTTYPDYGIDAPGVVSGFFAGSVGLATIGALVVSRASRRGVWLAAPVCAAAVGLGLLGCSMLIYAWIGKQRLRDHLLRQRVWRGDELVLDVGAGRGLMAIGAAKRAPGGHVIALDIWNADDLSGNNPQALLCNAAIENVGHVVEVVTGDARRLDLSDESVDVVVSVFCLHNLQPAGDRRTACEEIARVLKPGGSALIADFPSARGYLRALRQAGLMIEGSRRSERIALGISGYLVAHKPAIRAA